MTESTRRDFVVGASSIMGLFTIDEDGDGEYLDDLFGENRDEKSTNNGDKVSVILAKPEDEPAHENLKPEQTPAILVETDGELYSWGEDDGSWDWFASSGPRPTLEAISGANIAGAGAGTVPMSQGDGTLAMQTPSTSGDAATTTNNSSETVGVRASYYPTINDAIQALPANGGKLIIDDYFTIDYSISIDRHLLVTSPSKGHWSLNKTVGIELADGFTGDMFQFTTTDRYTKFAGVMLSGGDGDGGGIINANGNSIRYLTIDGCFLTRCADKIVSVDSGGHGTRIGGFTTIENNTHDVDLRSISGQKRVQIGNTYFTSANVSGGRDAIALTNIDGLTVDGVYARKVGRGALRLDGCENFGVSNLNVQFGGDNSAFSGQLVDVIGCSKGRLDLGTLEADSNSQRVLRTDSNCSDILIDGVLGGSPSSSVKSVNGTNINDRTLVF